MPPTKRRRTTKIAGKRTATAASSPPSPSSPAELAGNDDVLTNILLRLPIKSLQRFKSVSRNWLSLISSPEFSSRRTPHPSPISGLILKLSDHEIDYNTPEYDFIDPNKSSNPPPFRSLTFVQEYRSAIEILQSCNGLLLCRTSSAGELKTSYYVYNPTTRNYFTLIPRPRLLRGKVTAGFTNIRRITLAFDPAKSAHYKVVYVSQSNDYPERFQINIYSSESRSWRPSSVGSFAAEFNLAFDAGVYCNGSVFWVNPWARSLRFDVDEDRIHELPMPMPMPDDDDDDLDSDVCDGGLLYFGESGGHLHLVLGRFEAGTTCLNVSEIEKDYSGWFVKYRVDLAEVSVAFPEILRQCYYSVIHPPCLEDYDLSLLCVVDEEDSYLVLFIPGKLLRYNLKSGDFYKISDIEANQLFHSSRVFSRWAKAYQYIESLTASV